MKEEIRAVVIIQMPEDLYIASALALLQGEVIDSGRLNEPRRRDPSNWAKANTMWGVMGTSSIPGNSPISARTSTRPFTKDKRGTEASRSRSSGDKCNALRSYRRA